MFKLVLVAENDVEGTEEFESKLERSAYAEGFQRGGGCYGAGSCYAVNWELLDDEERWKNSWGDDEYSLKQLANLRSQAFWSPPKEKNQKQLFEGPASQ